MDETTIKQGDWTINNWVQKVCLDCLILVGETLNNGPQVAHEQKVVNLWAVELVDQSLCEEHE